MGTGLGMDCVVLSRRVMGQTDWSGLGKESYGTVWIWMIQDTKGHDGKVGFIRIEM